MKSLIKCFLARMPYRVIRRGKGNRFSAVEEALESLNRRGFAPRHVIDAFADVGCFTSLVPDLFPEAKVKPIELQPGCSSALDLLRQKAGPCLLIHSGALGAPDKDGMTVKVATGATSRRQGDLIFVGRDCALASEKAWS